ncbi:MAG: Mur ligase domain-containing protein, partial [bacterium]
MVNSLSDKKLLFVRICGTGMSSAALMAQKSGAVVSGVDNAFHPPVSDILERAEIKCFPMENFSDIMEANPPDMLIVGNALSGRSKEADIIRKTSINVYSMPSFLETFLIGDKKSVVVAGTHGKSTTSTMISEYLFNSGSSPSYFIGALTGFSGTNAE